MSVYNEFCKVAERFPDKFAILSATGQFRFKSLLEFLPSFEEQVLRITKGRGRRIAFLSSRYELYFLMILMASKHGYEMIFIRKDSSQEINESIDWVISDFPPSSRRQLNFIQIEVDRFKAKRISFSDLAAKPDQEAEFVFGTSGSTGLPKYFPVKDSILLNGIRSSLGVYGEPDHRRRAHCSAGYPLRWFNNVAIRVLLQGGSILALGKKAVNLPDYIDLWGVTTLCESPLMMKKILEVPNAEQFLSSVTTVVLGGANVDISLMRSTYEKTHAKVSVGYGSTETTGVCDFTYDPNEIYEPGFVGYHSDQNVDIGFFDENGTFLPNADEGILGVKSDKYIDPRDYLGQKSTDKSAFVDGYYITGDIFSRRGKKLFLIGREKQIINVGGNKFSLERIEAFLAERLPQNEFAIKVFKDPNGYELLKAFYVGSATPDEIKLNAEINRQFPAVEIGSFIKIDQFPMNDSGKLDRNALN